MDTNIDSMPLKAKELSKGGRRVDGQVVRRHDPPLTLELKQIRQQEGDRARGDESNREQEAVARRQLLANDPESGVVRVVADQLRMPSTRCYLVRAEITELDIQGQVAQPV